MEKTGLRSERVPAAFMEASGRPLAGHCGESVCVGLLQPDLVLGSWSLKKIALVELSTMLGCSSSVLLRTAWFSDGGS
jgi:hypothetical protein